MLYMHLRSVINTFRLSGDRKAANMALHVLNRMKKAIREENRTLKVDRVIYKTVLTCLALPTNPRHASASYEILQEMLEASKENEDVKPDSHCCNLVVKAFAKAGHGRKTATHAQQILVDLVQQYRAGKMSAAPGTAGFNQVLNAWSKTRDRRDAVKNAETVMKLMRELRDGCVEYAKPDKSTISLMFSIYALQKNESMAQSAQDLFDSFMGEIDYDRMLIEGLMNVWAKSDTPNKTEKILELKRLMEEKWKRGEWNMRPTTRTYNILLNACSYAAKGDAEDRGRALETAREAFRELKGSNEEKPDPITYGTMIQAVCNLSEDEPDKKVEEVKEIFDECCRSGMVGDMVVKEMWGGLDKETVEEIFGENRSEPPVSWKRNVKDFRSMKLTQMLGRTENAR